MGPKYNLPALLVFKVTHEIAGGAVISSNITFTVFLK